MTGKELAEEVHRCFPSEMRDRISVSEVFFIVRLIFETIIEAIMLDDSVRIRNFGRIAATFYPGGKLVWCEPLQREVPRKPNIKLRIIPSKRLKKMVSRSRMYLRALAKKEKGASGGEVQLRDGKAGSKGEDSSREG